MGRIIGQQGSAEQVVFLFTGWKLGGFLSGPPSERCDAILKGKFEMMAHDAAPIFFNFRLMASNEPGRIIPHLDLALDQPFERPRDLPFLIALGAKWQRAGFLYCL
jgi:hypothetical protein